MDRKSKKEKTGRRSSKSSSKFKILVIVLAVLVIAAAGVLGIMIAKDRNKEEKQEPENEFYLGEEVVQEEKINIFNGNDRPIAVMIDNHTGAWPHAGLEKAFIVYEIIVEGGETRLMPLFKGVDVANIGPVRSARHYFLDYALENDAIFVHYGWSPQAESDIKKLGVKNLNGMVESSTIFTRTKQKSAPHNVIATIEKLTELAGKKGYALKSDVKLLNYTATPVTLEEGEVANKVTIPFSQLQTVTWEYDEENEVYKRFARGKTQTDMDSGKQLTTKNILITFVKNSTLNDGENKGRQTLSNIGTFDGYYITNGKVIPIKCEKSSRQAQTEYRDLEGNLIQINDGNTYIHIVPTDAKVKYE